MAWTYCSGRISDAESRTFTCSADRCGLSATYRIRAMDDAGKVVDVVRCSDHAAALHYQKGLPFPPGLWGRPGAAAIPEGAAPEVPVEATAAKAPEITAIPVPVNVVRPRGRIVFEIPENAPTGFCESCRAHIFWIPSKNGVPMPIEALGEHRGESHFAHCAHANYHRKARS